MFLGLFWYCSSFFFFSKSHFVVGKIADNFLEVHLNLLHSHSFLFALLFGSLTYFREPIANFLNFAEIVELFTNFSVHILHGTHSMGAMMFFEGAAGEVVKRNLYFLLLGEGRLSLVGTWAWSLDVATSCFESLLFLDDGIAVTSFG